MKNECKQCPSFPNCKALFQVAPANRIDNHAALNVIKVPDDETLLKSYVVRRMAMIYKNLLPMPRRKLAGEIANIIWEYEGLVLEADGKLLRHLHIDPDYILGCDNDPSCSWLRDFLKYARREPLLKLPRNIKRYRILWLAIAIKYPHLLHHITCANTNPNEAPLISGASAILEVSFPQMRRLNVRRRVH